MRSFIYELNNPLAQPDDMYDIRNGEDELQRWKESLHPWTSPGSAAVFGNGCGAAGGNPYGCLCQERPANNCYGDDDRPYGACCDLPDEEVKQANF